MKDFFVSYNRADAGWAEWIAWELEAAGMTVVVQAWDFLPGSNFVLEMQRAAESAERTILVLSPDSLGAPFVQPEWAAAFARDPTGGRATLVPVRVRRCTPPGLLAQVVYIDLVDLDEPTARERLLAGVRPGRRRPETRPRFPAASASKESGPRFPGG